MQTFVLIQLLYFIHILSLVYWMFTDKCNSRNSKCHVQFRYQRFHSSAKWSTLVFKYKRACQRSSLKPDMVLFSGYPSTPWRSQHTSSVKPVSQKLKVGLVSHSRSYLKCYYVAIHSRQLYHH